MIGTYIRIKIDGKRTFRSAPEVPGDYEYWLKSIYDGRQKWHRVGRYDGVKKAKLLLEREQERKEAARKYGLVAPPAIGHLTVVEGVEKFIQRKVAAGKRPGTVTSYKFTLGLFQEFCPHLYVEEITGDTLLDFAAWCRKRGDAERTVANRFVDLASFMKFHGKTGLVPKSDWPKYTERRVESYTQEELDRFYKAAETDKERLLLDLLIHSGFRIGEIAHLCFSDVDFTGNKLHVQPKPQWNWVPKTHECRTVRVGAGKDTAIDRSIAMLGLTAGRQFTAYTPSGERSVSNLLGDKPEKRGSDKRIAGPKRHCIVTYEIEDTMAKSRGETSSLLQALQWMYDHNEKVFSDSRSSSIQTMKCRLSWLTALPVGEGEIDEETFRRVFGEGTSHGLISRMWFGFAEEKFDRRRSRHWQAPVDGVHVSTVEIDGMQIPQEETQSLFGQLTRARVEGFAPGIEERYLNWTPEKDWSGRDTFHILKIAVLIALINGHEHIQMSDWEFAEAWMAWQAKIRQTFSTGRARKVEGGQFNETVIREMEKRTARLKRDGKQSKSAKILGEGGKRLYFVRWKAMSNDGRWYKYGIDVEKQIDALVRMGALAYLVAEDGESGKPETDERWVSLLGKANGE